MSLKSLSHTTSSFLLRSHFLVNRLSVRKAVLVFTHSEALMLAADIIHVMDDGLIVESGVYSDLKRVQGLNNVRDS